MNKLFMDKYVWSDPMKGILFAILVLVPTGLALGQQTQNAFTPRQTKQSTAFAPQANQTRLAALQSTTSAGDESDKYVIMDDFDYGRESSSQRPLIGPQNDPRIRNAVQERPRYVAQSSERSAVSVTPSRRNNFQSSNSSSNARPASSQARDRLTIYDLQITPAYEDELKTKGYLYAPTTDQQAGSDQIRLFADTRRADSVDDAAKIFSSRVSTYQGNLVIDIDDRDLQRIEDGSYTLDGFDRYDAKGVVLRYVSRNNEKVDLTRLRLGTADSYASDSYAADNYASDSNDFRDRDVPDVRLTGRDSNNGRSSTGDRRRNDDGYGDWVLPTSRNNDRDLTLGRNTDNLNSRGSRDLTNTRDSRTTRDIRDSSNTRDSLDPRDGRYDTSPIRDSYQDRMVDIYRDRTNRQPDRLTDRRDDRRYEEVGYSDRLLTLPASRVVDDRQRDLDREFVELSDWQKDLAIKTRELEAQERELARLSLRNDPRTVRYDTTTSQSRQYRAGDLQLPYESNSPIGVDRYADSRLSTARNSASPYISLNNPASSLPEVNDPEFARYAKQNQEQLTRINKKMAAIDQANKLYAVETQLDAEHREQKLKQAQDKLKNVGRVTSFNNDGLVRNTLGGNMAAGRDQYPQDRLAANTGDPFKNGSGVADMSLRSGRSVRFDGVGNQGSPPFNSSGSSDKLARALWFVTLMSIGFNFYLALLARSFYSRYNELADELRETFSTSM